MHSNIAISVRFVPKNSNDFYLYFIFTKKNTLYINLTLMFELNKIERLLFFNNIKFNSYKYGVNIIMKNVNDFKKTLKILSEYIYNVPLENIFYNEKRVINYFEGRLKNEINNIAIDM